MTTSIKVDISVIVPSYNSRKLITQCLESIFRQKTRQSYEVIVVDSSDDGTSELIKNLYPSVKVIELKNRTFPGQARNVGIKESKGEIIVFTDSDCTVQNEWLDAIILSCEKKEGFRVIGGAVCNGTKENLIGTAEYILEFNEFIPSRPEGDARLLPTCNVAFNREIFEEYGYLDNVIKGSDTLFSRKIVESGEKIHFVPAFKVYHKNRTSLKKFLRNQYELGLGSSQIRKKSEMPGSILVKMPILVPLIPIVRLFGIGKRLFKYDKKLSIQYFILSPLIFSGLVAYSKGFWDGLCSIKEKTKKTKKHNCSYSEE